MLAAAVLLAYGVASVAAREAGGRHSRPAIHLAQVKLPASIAPGGPVRARGKVVGGGARRGLRVQLEYRDGKRWAREAARRTSRTRRFALRWKRTPRKASLLVRVALYRKKRRLDVSRKRRIAVRAGSGSSHRPGGGAGGGPSAGGGAAGSSNPAGIERLVLDADGVSLPPGSSVPVALPEPLVSMSSVESLSTDGQPALSAEVSDGELVVAASASTPVSMATLSVDGLGCTESGCGRPATVRVPVEVHGLEAPSGSVESFTTTSPDRIATASPAPEGLAGVTLRDELIVVIGTPGAPGSRSEADAIAEAVGAVVSGGSSGLGVYEFRWDQPQDLEQRKSELLGLAGVTSVAESDVGMGGETTIPSDWADDTAESEWPYRQIRAPQAWDETTGSDVEVGIVDSGQALSSHEDLAVVKSFGREKAASHATHVAGLACAIANGKGLTGVAWGCPIVTSGHRVEGTLYGGVQAFDAKSILLAAQAVAKEPGVKVVNMSLATVKLSGAARCASAGEGTELFAKALETREVFRQLFDGPLGRDIVWTIAAGNSCSPGPASGMGANSDLDNVIVVGATNSDRTLASFSNFGPQFGPYRVEVAAPGGVSVGQLEDSSTANGTIGVWSTWIGAQDGNSSCGAPYWYCPSYGTSMAAPMVAGVAALVRSAHPSYSAAEAARCITETAGDRVGSAATQSQYPAVVDPQIDYAPILNIVNAESAVACARLGDVPVIDLSLLPGNDLTWSQFSAASAYSVETLTTLPGDISDVPCVLTAIPQTEPSQGEIEQLDSYMDAGGRLIAMGEYGGGHFPNADPYSNGTLQNILEALESHIDIDERVLGGGARVTSQIAASPLGTGVARLAFAGTAGLQRSEPAFEVARTDEGELFIAAEYRGAGMLIVLGDTNVLSDYVQGGYGAGDNAQFARNVCP